MTTYEVKTTIDGTEYIEKTDADGTVSFIPKDESNADYQRYLNPESELGGTL